ncbi:thioredoxin-like protein [Ochromonadaceae sp. CCMP2298]|nr:thioredoxin-like protein [Ochromonadaceae sp. CCMP2298]|mmetsp:Transcript_20768/g.46238  ORF Transcript_20768/g.46238 Transcript_20768/m.46238 type:complete len:133 (+) Transcript_20768:35-433(+)
MTPAFFLVMSVMLVAVASFSLGKNFLNGSRALSMDARAMAEKAISGNQVMVFSKSYCPFCTKTKSSLDGLGISYGVFELDNMKEGADIQSALQDITGQRTVPNVFVSGKHIGGNDATQAAIKNGSFQAALKK